MLTLLGAIIPKQKPRDHVLDRTTLEEEQADPITVHFYPGKANVNCRLVKYPEYQVH